MSREKKEKATLDKAFCSMCGSVFVVNGLLEKASAVYSNNDRCFHCLVSGRSIAFPASLRARAPKTYPISTEHERAFRKLSSWEGYNLIWVSLAREFDGYIDGPCYWVSRNKKAGFASFTRKPGFWVRADVQARLLDNSIKKWAVAIKALRLIRGLGDLEAGECYLFADQDERLMLALAYMFSGEDFLPVRIVGDGHWQVFNRDMIEWQSIDEWLIDSD